MKKFVVYFRDGSDVRGGEVIVFAKDFSINYNLRRLCFFNKPDTILALFMLDAIVGFKQVETVGK